MAQDSGGISLTREEDLDPEFVALCRKITAKRARAVIEHILKHGIITTEELSDLYGYDHPPRAARDVRENGIPLITHSVIGKKLDGGLGLIRSTIPVQSYMAASAAGAPFQSNSRRPS